MLFAKILLNVFILLSSFFIGAFVGGISGLALGWLLALGYERQGPSDPGDAPAYVAMGLALMGACLGAVAGLIVGIVLCVRRARRDAV